MKYIVGNWKSNKNESEVREWFSEFSKLLQTSSVLSECKLVICPPAIYLPLSNELIKIHTLPISLGAQNISPFENGAYTGEITATQIKQYADYTIIGHSERRTHFHEGAESIEAKSNQANKVGLKSILCIQDIDTSIPADCPIVAYEPVAAIGTGEAEDSSEAEAVAEGVRSKYEIEAFLYGGSVTEENIASYFQEESIDGVLVGGASLTAIKFWNLIQKALNKS